MSDFLRKGRVTILLVQHTKDNGSAVWQSYPSLEKALEGVVASYEARLKDMNPLVQHIEYDISHLHAYIDELAECCALVKEGNVFVGVSKEELKDAMLNNLMSQSD
uniref:Enhancer of rudimentary homolog n=1 Tax=Rhizochromulina marina TaxID=1034831 RepID=A0A7S2RIP2_9STRA|mmetsp:Transcript_16947/g.49378  ORF Transcript_16947/g.49378 Transcript_16947/m.49378 type:complete len:106 (+) Transcript_16947:25-342(+)|eukprot:CAMPEP_0118978492 /NCGR_PEP_ID=MMETSP1173-20130426/23820_1 /TAXON_ID=1034831 /ORGANISM="Rhizochromulina marina cf, Strain CCMP1243" /LENGTH=105 /DNA_ID=CAMNT_0006928689 /DNA_START=19 /DNA_END=336 /DNA_ORIENTATION=-